MSVKVQVVILQHVRPHLQNGGGRRRRSQTQVPGAEVAVYQVTEHLPANVLRAVRSQGCEGFLRKSSRGEGSNNFLKSTPSFLARPLALAIWRDRCAIFSIKPARCG
jgi:hypothetical protein